MGGIGGLILVASLALPVVAWAQAVEVSPGRERVDVWPALRIAVPLDPNATPQEASALAASGDATSVDSPDRVIGRATRPHWAMFSLRNTAEAAQLRYLALEATTQYDTRLYARDDDGRWRHVNSVADDGGRAVRSRTINPIWDLSLAPRKETEFLLRVEGPSIVRYPLFAYLPFAYAERLRKVHVALGFALGACFFIGIFILHLRRHLEDRSVPLFICMLVANLLGALWLSGFLSSFLPMLAESTLSGIGYAGFAVFFGCGCQHARVYLNTPAWSNATDRSLQVLGWAWLATAPWFAAVFPVAARVLLVWGGTATALALVAIAVLAARRQQVFSWFIGAAWVSNLLMGSYFALARAIDNPLAWSPSSLALIQATAMAIFFGLAMSQRLLDQRLVLAAAGQEALMQAEKTAALLRERSLLFAATNHDLRQPLLGVGVFAELLRSARSQDEREEHARKLGTAIAEVDGLLLGIQQFASVHENSTPPAFETVGLDDLLQPIVEEYRNRSRAKQLTIRYVPTRMAISTHPPYFQRIVRNVLSNAIRYTESGGRVLVGCRRAGGTHLLIADTGRGMTEEQTRLAFEAFRRFDTDRSVPEGFGLGLFSARTLAHALDLEFRLTSRNGRGTEFRMFLREAVA